MNTNVARNVAAWTYNGDQDHWMVRRPTGWPVAYHELGHTQQRQEPEFQFSGETEAIVNFLWCYIRHVKFGDPFNVAFAGSQEHDSYTPDQAAVHWMVTPNFRDGRPMDETNSEYNEMRYQHRGCVCDPRVNPRVNPRANPQPARDPARRKPKRAAGPDTSRHIPALGPTLCADAKYADMARLFGWEAFTRAYYLENAAFERGETLPGNDLSGWGNQKRVLRLSLAVGYDLTAFFDFWGVSDVTPTPVDEDLLRAHMPAHSLGPSLKVRCLLLRYRGLIPADNAAFNSFFEAVYPGRPSGGASALYGLGWYNAWRDTYSATHGTAAKARVDQILSKHFTGASPDCIDVNTGGAGVDVARPTTYQWLLDFSNGSSTNVSAVSPPPPSPPPPSPPPPPFAPLGAGQALVEMQVTVITATFTVAGDVVSIDQPTLIASLRELFACTAPCVLSLSLTPASVAVTSQLTVPASATASVSAVSAAANALVARTPTGLGSALGLAVETIDPTVGVQTRVATVLVAPPPPAPMSDSGLGTAAIIGIAVGGAAVVVVVLLLCAFVCLRRHRSVTDAKQISDGAKQVTHANM